MAVAIEFGSQGSAASTSSVATIAGLDFNAEAGDRLIAASIAFEVTVSPPTISAVTIGGVSATQRAQAANSGRRAEIWVAAVPTGTSGDVVVTITAGDTTISAATFSVTGAEEVPTDTDAANGNGDNISITGLTIDTDGAGVAAHCNGFFDSTTSWTGASESHDTKVATAFVHSSAIVTAAGTNTITADGATATQALVGVAFGPSSGATTHSIDLDAASFAYTANDLGVVIKRVITLSPASFAYTANDLGVTVQQTTTHSIELLPASFLYTSRGLEFTATSARTTPAFDGPSRRRRRDRDDIQAYWAARQREANEEAERKRLEALAEAERALAEAENVKRVEAKRAAVRKVFAALKRAAVSERARADAEAAERAALEAIKARETAAQRAAYLEALDQLNAEIEAIGAEIARLYARRRQEEETLIRMWWQGAA